MQSAEVADCLRRGKVLAEAQDGEETLYVDIGVSTTICSLISVNGSLADPKTFEDARSGIPVTQQRRFDVYPDVSAQAAV